MKLKDGGLVKLMEECAELTQEAAKASQYIHNLDAHPDDKGNLKERIQNEIGDVLACILYVTNHFNLNNSIIEKRKKKKIDRFNKWDLE